MVNNKLRIKFMGRFFQVVMVALAVGNTPCFGQDFSTPLEMSGYTRLTSHADMMVYLKKIDEMSDRVELKNVGKSVDGRDLPLVMISRDKTFGSQRGKKPIVFFFAQQHGNEASGKEAALMVIREFVLGDLKDLLKDIDVLIMPMTNPDGGEKGQRRNANNMDLNRNHAILSEPEVVAIHQVFQEWMPEVTLDVHEYNAISRQWISQGFIKDAEEMLDRGTNLNIASSIRAFSDTIFIPEVGEKVKEDGVTFFRYIVGAPFENQRVRHSTTDINDGRQSLGIYNTLSFIIEGKRYGDLINRIERRTFCQAVILRAFLKTVVRHKKEILKIVQEARDELLLSSGNGKSIIQMDYFPDPERPKFTLPIFDLYSWRHAEKELGRYEPLVRAKKSVVSPHAYIFSREEIKLIDLLTKHRIEMHQFKNDAELEVETYTISHATQGMEEDKATEYVDVDVSTLKMKIGTGSVLVYLNQKAGQLIPLLLEPQSSYSICTERSGRQNRFTEYLEEGKTYPVLRLMDPVPLDIVKFEIK